MHPLAPVLPDVPRWVEARALLLSGECEVFGEPPSMVVRDPEAEDIYVLGDLDLRVVREALQHHGRGGQVVALPPHAPLLSALLGQPAQPFTLFVHPDPARFVSSDDVSFLDAHAIETLDAPQELIDELLVGREVSPIAARFVGDRPVAFCYAGAITESLWDVSIDTLPDFQRRGFAAACAAFMIAHMHGLGREPVWQSLDTNEASWRLAQKLGFREVDRLVLFEME
ncbi:MAG: GNAT family N-acetyltransferase [Acidobacteria bacterium]|nr:GNAT family N-acetyltransferase [Acidobacteriota bacterium]